MAHIRTSLKHLFLFILLLHSVVAFSLYKPDSLMHVLDTAKTPKVIIKTMTDLWYYHYEKNDLDNAFEWLQKARRQAIKINDSALIFSTTANTGVHYSWRQNYGAALYHYKLAFKFIKHDKNYYRRVTDLHLIVANIFKSTNQLNRVKSQLDSAEKYLIHVSEVSTHFAFNKDKASYFKQMEQIDSALKYYNIAINKFDDEFQYVLDAKKERSEMVSEYAALHKNWGKTNKALIDKCFNEYSTFYYTNINRVSVPAQNRFLILSANYFFSEQKIDSARVYYNKILKLNRDTIMPDFVLPILQLALKTAVLDKNLDKVVDLTNKIAYIKDSTLLAAQQNNLNSTESFFESEEQASIEKLNAQKAELTAEEGKQRNKTILIYSAIVFVILITGIILLRNRFKLEQKQKQIIELKNKETEEQKRIIELKAIEVAQKHKEITDSINYAERIQKSFLATKEQLDSSLKDYFVLFKPKDIVSGDFYWSSTLKNNNFILATADSTGHGVPGAILSLLNITSLEKAIESETEPSLILNATRKIIIDRLKKDGSADGGKDGMDVSVTVYDFKARKLIISSAHNPVWIVRGKETIEIKPDKMPVGKHDKQDLPFTQTEIQLQAGDVIYTLTDGFADQFGGTKGKKFMSKNLRELLAKSAQLPMAKQKELLETRFNDWAGNMEQVDDVTIIGVRV